MTIRISTIQVSGSSEKGRFEGGLFDLGPGLNVITARNAYGKSLLSTSLTWCFGLEPMHGSRDNDSARFPPAVRDVIELDGDKNVPVHSSEVAVSLERHDGARVRITRAIAGDLKSEVQVEEQSPEDDEIRDSRLLARSQTLKDETGGLQSFLFSWLGLPAGKVLNSQGKEVSLYLENLAPLFLIDQNEGWVDLQSLQVFRYGQREITQAAFEYLLGAETALHERFLRQLAESKEAQLKAEAESLSARVEDAFQRRGCPISWSHRGTIRDISKRWSKEPLIEAARRQFDLDLGKERRILLERSEKLRKRLLVDALDPEDAGAASQASSQVIELKQRRHKVRSELGKIRTQLAEQRRLLTSIEHRIQSSKDVLRLKSAGIGRLEVVECPTCHRSIAPEDFSLSEQSKLSVSAHVESLNNDRLLLRSNIGALRVEEERIASLLARIEEDSRDAQRTLSVVNTAVGTLREQIGKAAADLAATERKIDQLDTFSSELKGLQQSLDDWVANASSDLTHDLENRDLNSRRRVFLDFFRINLMALGHSEISRANQAEVRIDEDYVPYLGPRRLRSMGSASDYSRLVAGYVLALAEASLETDGPHPGFIVLDEPLQQNPDTEHREKFITFLRGLGASEDLPFQVIVLTFLQRNEIDSLRESGVSVRELEGDHLLSLAPEEPEEPEEGAEGQKSQKGEQI